MSNFFDPPMPNQAPCELCKTLSAVTTPSGYYDGIQQKCQRCGEFKLTEETRALLQVPDADVAVRTNISGWVYDQNRNGTVPTITSHVLQQISARSLPTINERADRLLLEALRRQNKLGDMFNINDPRFVAATYSQDAEEVLFLMKLLKGRGWMDIVSNSRTCEVLPNGYLAADELTRRAPRSNKGFVAMSFDNNLKPAYEEGFQVGVLKAGYDPVRVDQVEHTNRIDDEIIAHIRTASFVVADFTGHRGGVYFEAGFALGLDIPVIWTCKKDDMQDLHFDIRQYNTIDWENHEELASRLQHRIEASVGKGSKTVLDS